MNCVLRRGGESMTFYRDGLPLPLDHSGPITIPAWPGWTLIGVIRGCFGLELTWRKMSNKSWAARQWW